MSEPPDEELGIKASGFPNDSCNRAMEENNIAKIDNEYSELLRHAALRKAHRHLSNKIVAKVYEHGFLR